ncbi:MAG: MXAN_5187 C-terminal domain-containing protein [Deltaproteobacteria bacterium]|nr:MXAN_5187 C-terminal domain-containing protein [Deltaproteobacteria bacterium]
MFQFRFVLLVALIPLAGVLALLGTTGIMHGVVMTPYEAAAATSVSAAGGAVARFASESVDAASRASSDSDVHTALAQKKMTPAAEAALLAAAGTFGAPSFALLVSPDGSVAAAAGADSKLPSPLAGFPVVAEALTGIARDGLWIQEGKPVHVVAAAIWDGDAAIGSVLLGWPWTPELLATLQRMAGTPVFVVGADKQTVIGTPTPAYTLEAIGHRDPFGDPTSVYGPLPILMPDRARFTVSSMPLYPGEPAFNITTIVDRDAGYGGLATLQAGIIGLSLLLGVLVLAIVVMTMKAVSRPLELILDHLAKAQQGANVGILPEAGLDGPFLRLGKQINNILQAMPSARPGAGSLGSPPMFSPGFDGPQTSEAPSQPAALFSEPPQQTPRAPSQSFSQQPPSFSQPPQQAQQQSQPPTAPVQNGNGSGASPAAPAGGLSGLFDDGPDPLAAFRVPTKAAPPPTPPPQPAPQPQPSFDELPDGGSHGMQPEATVMFQVPASLLEASGAADRKPVSRAPPPPPPPTPMHAPMVDDNRTVVAQVPHELLAQVAPKNDVDASDEAHYKEVYEKFVQSRIECGEDTSDLSYERFVAKLLKNRQQIVEKHKAKSVRFQVYVKDGKAALRALPVRD